MALQFVIVVVDSTDRERISVTREELYRMLAHEVSPTFLLWFLHANTTFMYADVSIQIYLDMLLSYFFILNYMYRCHSLIDRALTHFIQMTVDNIF